MVMSKGRVVTALTEELPVSVWGGGVEDAAAAASKLAGLAAIEETVESWVEAAIDCEENS